jgi:hypothetical protein
VLGVAELLVSGCAGISSKVRAEQISRFIRLPSCLPRSAGFGDGEKSQTRMAFVGLEKLLKPNAVVRRRWPKVKGEER